MKLAILDAVPEIYWVTDGGITDARKFSDMLDAAGYPGEMQTFYVAEGEWPASVHDFDAYLVTGSPCCVHDALDWIGQLERFVADVAERRLPLVGVCFGHQLIARIFGGRVERHADGWLLGLPSFELFDLPAWMEPTLERSLIYHINQDQVTELPAVARCIGTSPRCRFGAFVIDEDILCVQGHPEQPARAMRNFIEDLSDQLPASLRATALAEIGDRAPHAEIWGRWICQFYVARCAAGHTVTSARS